MTKLVIAIIIFAMVCIIVSYCQAETMKYNRLFNRYDFEDDSGHSNGYMKYNPLYERYNFYNRNGGYDGHWKYNELFKKWEYRR